MAVSFSRAVIPAHPPRLAIHAATISVLVVLFVNMCASCEIVETACRPRRKISVCIRPQHRSEAPALIPAGVLLLVCEIHPIAMSAGADRPSWHWQRFKSPHAAEANMAICKSLFSQLLPHHGEHAFRWSAGGKEKHIFAAAIEQKRKCRMINQIGFCLRRRHFLVKHLV